MNNNVSADNNIGNICEKQGWQHWQMIKRQQWQYWQMIKIQYNNYGNIGK